MSGYLFKYRDGCWQIEIVHGLEEPRWIRVDSEADAYTMSASLDLMHAAAEGDRVGDGIARELESVAALFSKYGCDMQAAWIVEHAKFARGEPSVQLS